ncbi:MAG: hypothetical protein JNL08_16740 [Planctomycetes bacterium]|nr:hypothetical protein [Planctomycetota bacterium]
MPLSCRIAGCLWWIASLAAQSPGVATSPAASLAWLRAHAPAGDADLPAALLEEHVRLAHAARAQVPWGAALADELFAAHVLPYAIANETREAWRAALVPRCLPLVAGCTTPGEAALRLNAALFDLLGVHYSTARRRADASPLESIADGKASCTGLSMLLVAACRACCVPARLVSVRWPHKPGNHTWVEVWDGAAWRFVGADEPDPQGFDRAWFTGDAARCATAAREHRIWAVSFVPTGERFAAGWADGVLLHGEDVTARYAAAGAPAAAQERGDDALLAQLARFFAADAERQRGFVFDRNLDTELGTAAGDARLRALAWRALCEHERPALAADHAARVVRAGAHQSPFTVEQVGSRPASGWPLVIAMHGGGGVPKAVNDAQWRHMQVYYRAQPQVGGYLYCALRAPTDEWNGFYTDYAYPLVEKLIRQFVVCDGVDPDRIVAIGYSHGGYGAFALGPKLPHRFAAVHASAAAPTDGETSPVGLHTLRFSSMVGGRDTAYGRRERCERFAAELAALQAQRPGHYPATFTLVEGNGHTGLPDRDLLATLVPLARTALPRALWWQPTDAVVQDHYWLHVPAPRRGLRLEAALDGQRLTVATGGAAAVSLLLDARLVDLGAPLELVVDGAARTVEPAPSLRTLCATMLQRGDPVLAASVVVPLP